MPAKSSPQDIDRGSITRQLGERLPANRLVLFLCLAIGGVALDLVTKSAIFHYHFQPEIWAHRPQQTYWLIEDIFGVQCSMNPGALFGFGKGYSSVFAAISFVAIFGIIIWLFVFKQAWDRWLTTAFGLITGGILGNLYDRLGFGYLSTYPEEIKDNVRDWILFRVEGVRIFDPWPNFNIADSLLVTGAIMLFIQTIFEAKKQHRDGDEGQHEDVEAQD